MKLFTSALVIIWLVVLTLTSFYNTGTDQKLLGLIGRMIDDNLKNVVVSGKETYYVVGVKQADLSRGDKTLPLFVPLYANEQTIGKMIDKSREEYLMVKEFQKMELDAAYAAAKADRFFKTYLKKGANNAVSAGRPQERDRK